MDGFIDLWMIYGGIDWWKALCCFTRDLPCQGPFLLLYDACHHLTQTRYLLSQPKPATRVYHYGKEMKLASRVRTSGRTASRWYFTPSPDFEKASAYCKTGSPNKGLRWNLRAGPGSARGHQPTIFTYVYLGYYHWGLTRIHTHYLLHYQLPTTCHPNQPTTESFLPGLRKSLSSLALASQVPTSNSG